jgi:DNA-binding NtrC family response regulator
MSSPPTILIVDDEPQVLQLVGKMLGSRPIHVLLAPGPSEALRIAQSQSVDLLISDIVMPEMDGSRLAESVLKMHPGASVLLISGQSREVPSALRSPRVKFLRKPFFPSQLIQLLHDLLPEN